MISSILGKKKKDSQNDGENKELKEKISKMNLSEMRIYVNDKLNSFAISEFGLSEVMRVLVSKNANGKRFIESDAMDSKIKKAFELVIIISKSKKMTITTTELIQEFILFYRDLITDFDKEYKDIYRSKLEKCLENSLATLAMISEYKRKKSILGE